MTMFGDDIINFKYVSGDERESLYNEVWSEPVTVVAKRYNMSDSGLRKHCKRLEIPIPYSGYWSKLKAGKSVGKTPLPKVHGTLKKYVHNYVIKLKTDIENFSDDELISNNELNLLSEETIRFINEKCSKIRVKNQLRNPNQMIIDHKEECIYRKKRDKALKNASFNLNYYENVKRKYREEKPVLPISVSDFNINRAYRIIDSLISALNDMEGYIRVYKDSEKDVGEFIVMGINFYFELKEEMQKVKEERKINGRKPILIISFKVQGWYDKSLIEHFIYKDTDTEPLESQLGKIIYHMFVTANRFKGIEVLDYRKEKRKWEEEERQRHLEQMRAKKLENIKMIEQVVLEWDKAEKFRSFANSVENKLDTVSDNRNKEKIKKWLNSLRNIADWMDPLVAKEADCLVNNKHIFDRIIDDNIP